MGYDLEEGIKEKRGFNWDNRVVLARLVLLSGLKSDPSFVVDARKPTSGLNWQESDSNKSI
jgi:hypothetical protein